jgi:hypothetical protein
MYKELKELETHAQTARENYERRVKGLEVDVIKFEEKLLNMTGDFRQQIVNCIAEYYHDIKSYVEDYNDFKFDGLCIDRKKSDIKIFMSDNKQKTYELEFNGIEFIYQGTVDEDITEDFNRVLSRINLIPTYF